LYEGLNVCESNRQEEERKEKVIYEEDNREGERKLIYTIKKVRRKPSVMIN
jgi:hypothetical protein